MGVNVQTRYSTTLSADITDTATTINVTLAPAFSTGYATIDRGNSSQEDIKWLGLSGTQMTSCYRGLSSTATTDTEVAGNKKSHIATATIEGTTLHYIINNKADIDDSETITGSWTFTGLETFQRTATTGYSAYFTRNLANTSTDSPIVYMYNQNASDDQPTLTVSSAITGASSFTTEIYSVGATGGGALVTKNNSKGNDTDVVYLSVNGAAGNGSNQFIRNLASANTAGPVTYMENTNTGDDQPVLTLKQSAPKQGMQINMSTGNGDPGIKITKTTNSTQTSSMITLIHNTNDTQGAIGINMNLANAGAGLEYALLSAGSESGITAAGNAGFVSDSKGTFTLVGFIRAYIQGATVYIPYGNIA